MAGGLVPGADVLVERLLGLADVIAPSLERLLADLDLAAPYFCQGFPSDRPPLRRSASAVHA